MNLLFLKRKISIVIFLSIGFAQICFAQFNWYDALDHNQFPSLLVQPLENLVGTGLSDIPSLTRTESHRPEDLDPAYFETKQRYPHGLNIDDLPKLNFLFVPNYMRKRVIELSEPSRVFFRTSDYIIQELMSYNNPSVGAQKIVEFIDSHKKFIESDPILARDIFHLGFKTLYDYALKTRSKSVYHVLFSQSYRYKDLILECGYCLHAPTVFKHIAISAENEYEQLFLTPEERIDKYLDLLNQIPKIEAPGRLIRSGYDYKGTPDFVKVKYAMENLLQIFLQNPELQTKTLFEQIDKTLQNYTKTFSRAFFYTIYSKRYLYIHLYGNRQYNTKITNTPRGSYIFVKLEFNRLKYIDNMESQIDLYPLFGHDDYPHTRNNRLVGSIDPHSSEIFSKFNEFKKDVDSKKVTLKDKDRFSSQSSVLKKNYDLEKNNLHLAVKDKSEKIVKIVSRFSANRIISKEDFNRIQEDMDNIKTTLNEILKLVESSPSITSLDMFITVYDKVLNLPQEISYFERVTDSKNNVKNVPMQWISTQQKEEVNRFIENTVSQLGLNEAAKQSPTQKYIVKKLKLNITNGSVLKCENLF